MNLYRWGQNIWPWRSILGAERQNTKILLNQVHLSSGLSLDIGCGTGGSMRLVGSRFRVMGLDRDKHAVKLIRDSPLPPLIVGEANHLPIKPCSFDLVIAVGISEYLSDLDAFFREVVQAGRLAHRGPFELYED